MKKLCLICALCLPIIAISCASLDPIRTETSVDLNRFMGDWYVIANIPTFIEKEAHRAVESYELGEDGVIETTFTFRKGGFDGPEKVYRPKGWVRDENSNAVWDMQFVWPFKAEYRIVFVDEGYTQTVIGRRKRDYVWIMARSPSIPESNLQALLELLHEEGYDTNKVQRVPQLQE